MFVWFPWLFVYNLLNNALKWTFKRIMNKHMSVVSTAMSSPRIQKKSLIRPVASARISESLKMLAHVCSFSSSFQKLSERLDISGARLMFGLIAPFTQISERFKRGVAEYMSAASVPTSSQIRQSLIRSLSVWPLLKVLKINSERPMSVCFFGTFFNIFSRGRKRRPISPYV